MLIPRFSIRFLLLLTTVCAVFFFIVTLATQGSQWATAVSVAMAGLVLTMLVQASTFGVAWALTTFFGVFRRAESAKVVELLERQPEWKQHTILRGLESLEVKL